MSDPKNDKPEEDVVATEGNNPEIIGDEALDDANGGWGFLNTNFSKTSMVNIGVDAETITATAATKDIVSSAKAETIYGGEAFLRTRPGRI